MDRNVVIATVLIALIMLVWMVFLSPRPEVTPTNPEGTPPDTSEEARPDLVQDSVEARTGIVTDTSLVGVQEGEERFIVVKSDLYTARLSTRGATIESFVLNKYTRFDQKTPVEMVDRKDDGAIGLIFTTPQSHNVDSRSLYFTADIPFDTLVVSGTPGRISFETPIGEGTLKQIYTFHSDDYEVDLNIQKVNGSSFMTSEGYELAWYGGLPFTEDNLEDEARHAGAYSMSGGEVEYIDLIKKQTDNQVLSGDITWVSVKNKYFTSVIIPQGETRGAELEGATAGTVEDSSLWKDYSARVIIPASSTVDSVRMYIGPLEYYRITRYGVGLYEMVDYGYDFFEWMTRPLAKFIFIPLFTFLGRILSNYGLVIIVFSIIMKIALHPLTKSSFKNMARMRELQPKMETIKQKYPDNPQKQQEAMMKMYKETGINPLGGCLPMLLQWPVLIALYQFIPQSLQLRQASFLWADDLSAPDVILRLPFSVPFYGNFVAGFTLLMGLSMIVQMKLQMQTTSNTQAKIMTYMMPVMLFLIFNRFASGLSLYYLVYNIVTAVQQKFMNDAAERKKAEGITDEKPVKKRKTKRRSIWEEAARRQRAASRRA